MVKKNKHKLKRELKNCIKKPKKAKKLIVSSPAIALFLFFAMFCIPLISAGWWDYDYKYCKNINFTLPSNPELRVNEPLNISFIINSTDYASFYLLFTGTNLTRYSIYYNNIHDFKTINQNCYNDGNETYFELITNSSFVNNNKKLFIWYDNQFNKTNGSAITSGGWIHSDGKLEKVYDNTIYHTAPYSIKIAANASNSGSYFILNQSWQNVYWVGMMYDNGHGNIFNEEDYFLVRNNPVNKYTIQGIQKLGIYNYTYSDSGAIMYKYDIERNKNYNSWIDFKVYVTPSGAYSWCQNKLSESLNPYPEVNSLYRFDLNEYANTGYFDDVFVSNYNLTLYMNTTNYSNGLNYSLYSVLYNTLEIEGTEVLIIMNISFINSSILNPSYLVYNNTRYQLDYTDTPSNLILYKFITLPYINTDTNKSFYFEINLDTDNFNSSYYNQTIQNIIMDNCTVNTVRIFNITLYDEESQNLINATADNSTIEANLLIKSLDGLYIIANYSNIFYRQNPIGICTNINLTNSSLRVDGEISYYSVNRVKEFYNLQNTTIRNSTVPKIINLYDLNNISSTTFLITYKDSNYNPVPDALIIIQRKYLSEGIFKTVEIPKTDIGGQTLGHFQLEGTIYSIYVTKNGQLLSTFDNVVVSCDNLLINDCKINLIPIQSNNQFDTLDVNEGVYYSLDFNEANREVTADFVSIDSSSVNMILNVYKMDLYSNTSLCVDTVTAQSGSLSCIIPASDGNITIYAELLKDSSFITSGIYKLNPKLSDFFSSDRIFFVIAFVILIPLMFISSTVGILIGLGLSLLLSSLLYLMSTNSFIGKTSSLMWIALVIGITIYKLVQRSRE